VLCWLQALPSVTPLQAGTSKQSRMAFCKHRLLTLCLGVCSGGSDSAHLAFPHSQAVKARRVATWAYLATAAIRRVGIILEFVARAFARRAAIVQFLLVRPSLTLVLCLKRLGVAVVAIAARILATARLLHWSRDWCSNWLSSGSRWTATVASHC
jgi:hypothetical protein